MADICDVYTVAGMTMNHATADTLIVEVVDGLDGVDVRRTIPPRGQAAGAIFLPGQDSHRIVTFNGYVGIRSVEWDDTVAYRAAQESLVQSWISAIAGITNTVGSLAWPSHTLAVYKNQGPRFMPNGQSGEFGKKFILSLYAPSPTIT